MNVKIQGIAAAVALISTTLLTAAETRSACELLPPSIVYSITGRAIQADAKRGQDAVGRKICSYFGDHSGLTLSVLSLTSETQARRAFAQEVTRSFGGAPPPQPVHGVGVEALIWFSGQPRTGVLVARHGAVVFALSGPFEQPTLVALARSVVAHLEREKSS